MFSDYFDCNWGMGSALETAQRHGRFIWIDEEKNMCYYLYKDHNSHQRLKFFYLRKGSCCDKGFCQPSKFMPSFIYLSPDSLYISH
jgi:hypothetical protein